jgi:hypothetical protein
VSCIAVSLIVDKCVMNHMLGSEGNFTVVDVSKVRQNSGKTILRF